MKQTTAMLAVAALLIFAMPAFAAKRPEIIPPGSSVYIVPSPAAKRLAHSIEHPGLFDHKMRDAKLKVVADAADADYTLDCDRAGPEKSLNPGLSVFAGAYFPMTVALTIRDAGTGKMLAYEEKRSGGGRSSDKFKAKIEALSCSSELSKLIKN